MRRPWPRVGPQRHRKQNKTKQNKLLLLLLLLLLLTAIEFSLGGSSPYTSTGKKIKNKYTQTKRYKNTVQTIETTVNTSTHIAKTHKQC